MRAQSPRSARGHGYSLVELAIALAVIGLVMGGLTIPIGNQLRAKVYRHANVQVGDAVDAVVGYAIAHRTPGFLLVTNPAGGTPALRFYGYRSLRIPSGRPYLPCPDTDGDGYENRAPLMHPAAVGSTEFNKFAAETRFFDSQADINGHCVGGYSGNLPWRTLGLAESDPWGSRLTYIVDRRFTFGAYGFDQETRANALPLFTALPSTNKETLTAPTTSPDEWPLLACDLSAIIDDTKSGCSQSYLPYNKAHEVGSVNSYSSDTTKNGNNYFLTAPAAGYLSPRSSFLQTTAVAAISDGLPFVIISHGANRSGASTAHSGSPDICADVPAASTTSAEAVNASHALNLTTPAACARTLSRHQLPETLNKPRGNYLYAVHRASTSEGDTSISSEYPDPLSPGSNLVFDDVVTWLTRRELGHRLLREGVFPLEVFGNIDTAFGTFLF